MDIFEDLPILLNFKLVEDDLILRLDNEGLRNFTNHHNAISEITLRNVKTSKSKLKKELEDLRGLTFEYRVISEEKKVFEFIGDYYRVTILTFEFFEENSFDYDISDLSLKGKWISKLYSDLYKSYTKNNAIYTKKTNSLITEIKDNITRFERKAEFFEDKSTAYLQSIKASQKLLKILETSNN